MGRKREQRYTNSVGIVARAQVPMVFTFDENVVEYIAEHLGNSLEMSYKVLDLFTDSQDEDEDYFG